MIKLVCFDLDGVLLDSTEWHFRSFNEAMLYVTGGGTISLEEHESVFNGLPTKSKLSLLVKQERITKRQADLIAELKSKYFKKIVNDEMTPDESKIKVMHSLRNQRIKISVVSNCSKENIQLLLHKLGLLDEVDLWVSAEDVDNPKPAPDGYIRAMDQFKVSPLETIIFEDSKVGLFAAYASEAHVIEVVNPEKVTTTFVNSRIASINGNMK